MFPDVIGTPWGPTVAIRSIQKHAESRDLHLQKNINKFYTFLIGENWEILMIFKVTLEADLGDKAAPFAYLATKRHPNELAYDFV